jgi:hypothetical protein
MDQRPHHNWIRVLARDLAEPLTDTEIKQVSGGAGRDCRTLGKVTYFQGQRPDVEAVLDCNF